MSEEQPNSRPDEPLFLVPPVVPVFAAVFVVAHAALQWAPPAYAAWAYQTLALVPARFLASDVWVVGLGFATLLTHALLHADWMHVSVNAALVLAAAGPVYRNCGLVGLIVLFSLCTIAGGAAHLAVYWGSNVTVIGASGGAAGLMAAALRYRTRRLSRGELVSPIARSPVLPFTTFWIGLNAAFFIWDSVGGGFASGLATIAHIFGYLAGLFLAPLLVRGARPQPWPAVDRR
jgi:membrane associated rhomboid family serine protease